MKSLKEWVYERNAKFFLRNIILLESNPDFSDNTRYVYEELLNREINKKYKIIWLVKNKDKFKNICKKNVYFIERSNKLSSKIKVKLLRIFAKYIIDCNNYIDKINKNQFRIHLTHGTPLKIVPDYCKRCGKIDYLVEIGDYFSELNSKLFFVPKEKIIDIGFPRNDALFLENEVKYKFYDKSRYDKLVFWLPTYRNHKAKKNKPKKYFPFGVPILKTDRELNTLNKFLSKNKILLAIKLHPGEDSSHLKSFDFSNIILIDDQIFVENHSTVMDILRLSDALITDYSSVYYDYLLLNRPIGMAIEDLKEYSKNTQLLFDDFEKNLPAEYIYNFKDLMSFFDNLIIGKDKQKKARTLAIKKYHTHCDGLSSKRVVDILEQKIREDYR